jgi:uncharacterized membrane protein (DUF106 family)
MEHPFISNLDDKSLEELQTTISKLTTKLSFAYRSHNAPLISQLNMAIESYRNAYQKKINEMMKNQNVQIHINNTKEKK